MLLIPPQATARAKRRLHLADVLLILGALFFVLPPMFDVARFNWSTEQGGHGPIVLATGVWLLFREFHEARPLRQPGNRFIGFSGLAVALAAYVLFGITGILEIHVAVMYAALVCAAYLLIGGAALRVLWFPIFYLAFALPPPNTVVAVITGPPKIAISQAAVALLHSFGYPVGSSGVMIQIAQYQVLVAAACAGLNSLITLSAIGLFYVYLRHRSDLTALIAMSLVVIPVAILANFVRVIVLILITFYFGESAAQGFMHDFAGLVMFAAALAAMLTVEAMYSKFKTPGSRVSHDG